MKKFNKQAAMFGALFAVALTLIIGLVGFAISISSQGDNYTVGEVSKQGHFLGLYAIVFIVSIALATGFIKKKA